MKLVKDADQLQEKKHKISDEKAEEAVRTIINSNPFNYNGPY